MDGNCGNMFAPFITPTFKKIIGHVILPIVHLCMNHQFCDPGTFSIIILVKIFAATIKYDNKIEYEKNTSSPTHTGK